MLISSYLKKVRKARRGDILGTSYFYFKSFQFSTAMTISFSQVTTFSPSCTR